MGSASQPRDDHGRWTAGGSGAETGDHLKVSPSPDTRNVAGHNIPRSQVVTKHGSADSVGTSSGGGGSGGGGSGGGGSPVVHMGKNAKPTPASATAKNDRIRQMKATDQRHYGIPGDIQDRVGKMLPKTLRGPSARGWPYNN